MIISLFFCNLDVDSNKFESYDGVARGGIIFMKKILAILVVALLVLTGCGAKDKPEANGGDKGTAEAGKTYNIGTAVYTTEKSVDPGEEDGKFEVNTYYATVVMDEDKFVNVYIDTAQNSIKLNAAGELVGFEGKGTKKELGPDYNMKKFGNAVAEWFEQIESLEDWMKGKTLSEVLSMETYEKDESHPAVPAEEDLKSSVTIDVGAYLTVVEKAVANAVEVKDVVEVGTASTTSASKDGIEINSTISAVALNGNKELVYTYIDVAQNSAEFADGKIASKGIVKSKKELGPDYNMKTFGGAIAEWDEQIVALEKYTIGKTVSQVLETPREDGVATEDLKSSVTIGIDGYLEAIEKAANQTTKL